MINGLEVLPDKELLLKIKFLRNCLPLTEARNWFRPEYQSCSVEYVSELAVVHCWKLWFHEDTVEETIQLLFIVLYIKLSISAFNCQQENKSI